jgi:hypothetical protein
VITDKHVRTRSGYPALVIKILQRRYAAGEERSPQLGGITEPSDKRRDESFDQDAFAKTLLLHVAIPSI